MDHWAVMATPTTVRTEPTKTASSECFTPQIIKRIITQTIRTMKLIAFLISRLLEICINRPQYAEREIGFPFWLLKVWNVGRNSGSKMVFYGNHETLEHIRKVQSAHPIECEFESFDDWEDFLVLLRNFRRNDSLTVVMSRKDNLSYHSQMGKIPNYFNTYFKEYSFMLIYPMQLGLINVSRMDFKNDTYIPLETFEDISNRILMLFKRK